MKRKAKLYCGDLWSSAIAENEPPSEIIIERFHGYWTIVQNYPGYQHHYLPAIGRAYPDHTDPLIVAKALKSRAAGDINVIVNL